MDVDMQGPEELRTLDMQALIGLTAAEARERIEAAGGTVRAVAPGQPMTMEYRPDRVTIVVVDDMVSEVMGIG